MEGGESIGNPWDEEYFALIFGIDFLSTACLVLLCLFFFHHLFTANVE